MMKPYQSTAKDANKDRMATITATDPKDHTNELHAFLTSSSILEMVSVQLKTTMNTVLGFLNLSKDERLSQQTKGIFTDYVYASSSGLLQLFNNLIELYQIINGTDVSTTSKIDLNDLLIDLKTKYHTELKFRKPDQEGLALHLPGSQKKQMLTIDRNKLVSILEALIQNAIDFSGQGTIEYGYTVQKNNDLEFFFHSPGAHFSQAQLESALHAYIRHPNGLDISHVMASIRLEVAKRLVEKLDGKLWSSSTPADNSSFYFSISGEKQKRLASGALLSENTSPDWSHFKVLIAEDVDSNFLLLQAMLSPTKINIERAGNGLETVRVFKENPKKFDLILMDIMMPELDGFEAAARIKKMDPSIPIIGQTAYCLESDDIEGKLNFFNDFLTKPIWDHELRRMLHKYLPKK